MLAAALTVGDQQRLVARVGLARKPLPTAREQAHVAPVGIELARVEHGDGVRDPLPLDHVERPPARLRVMVHAQSHALGVQPQHGDPGRAAAAIGLAVQRGELEPRGELPPVRAAAALPQHEPAD